MQKYMLDRTSTNLTGPGIWALRHAAAARHAKVDTANIRSGPNLNNGVIGTLKRGAYLARGSKAQIGGVAGATHSSVWYRVRVPSIAKVGYMHPSVASLV